MNHHDDDDDNSGNDGNAEMKEGRNCYHTIDPTDMMMSRMMLWNRSLNTAIDDGGGNDHHPKQPPYCQHKQGDIIQKINDTIAVDTAAATKLIDDDNDDDHDHRQIEFLQQIRIWEQLYKDSKNVMMN
jgi:hypothetical protein